MSKSTIVRFIANTFATLLLGVLCTLAILSFAGCSKEDLGSGAEAEAEGDGGTDAGGEAEAECQPTECDDGVQCTEDTFDKEMCACTFEPRDNNCQTSFGFFCDLEEGCVECKDGETRSCGTDVGACVSGIRTCYDGTWGEECVGWTTPVFEDCSLGYQTCCDGIDNDCNGDTDLSDYGCSFCDGYPPGEPRCGEGCVPCSDGNFCAPGMCP